MIWKIKVEENGNLELLVASEYERPDMIDFWINLSRFKGIETLNNQEYAKLEILLHDAEYIDKVISIIDIHHICEHEEPEKIIVETETGEIHEFTKCDDAKVFLMKHLNLYGEG